MQLHDTTLRMRELLIERGIDLTPERADARSQYEGPGQNAMQAWEAFRAVAIEPAFDPIREWGDVQAVGSVGFSLRPCSRRAGRVVTAFPTCPSTTS